VVVAMMAALKTMRETHGAPFDLQGALARTGHPLDVTDWVLWFVHQVQVSCDEASRTVDDTLAKARFWMDHSNNALSERQRKVVNLLLDAGPNGFEGGMSTKKYESIGGTSRATASRELIELEDLKLLARTGAGRSTRYYVNLPGWGPDEAA